MPPFGAPGYNPNRCPLQGPDITAGPDRGRSLAQIVVVERRDRGELGSARCRPGRLPFARRNSYTLIVQLRQEGIPVIMLSGSIESSAPALREGVTTLENRSGKSRCWNT